MKKWIEKGEGPMPSAALFGVTAGGITFAGFLAYIIAILSGSIKPSRATWWIWTLAGALIAAGYYRLGAGHTIWVPIGNMVGPFVVSILCIWYGTGGWELHDRLCLLFAMFGAALWFFVGPFWMVATVSGLATIGAIPMIMKIYKNPQSESLTAWLLFLVAGIVNVFAVEEVTLVKVIYVTSIIAGSFAVSALIVYRRWFFGWIVTPLL